MSSWASQRRLVLVVVALSLVIGFGVLIAIPFIYKTPSCSDGRQNQGETGIDCGGSCSRVCTAEAAAPNVRFVRTLSQLGRVDVVAYIDNRNQNSAAKNAPYTIEVYDATRTLVGKKQGTIDLAPGMTTPLFVPGIPTGAREAIQAFVTFDPEEVKWYRYEGKVPTPRVREAVLTNGPMPRITAELENETVKNMPGVSAVVTVFDTSNNVIAASRTVVGEIIAGKSVQAIFTWPAPFSKEAVRIEVLPVPVP